jgi:hypothetical protein
MPPIDSLKPLKNDIAEGRLAAAPSKAFVIPEKYLAAGSQF